MKNIVTTFLLMSCFHLSLLAQQAPQYTHFMQNKMAFNPAYAGSHEAASVSALYRSQWTGLEGAPTTQTVFTHMPLFENKVGFGLGLIHDNHGATNDWTGSMSYAYRFQIGKGKLSIGVNGSVMAQRVDWTELSGSVDPNDPAIPTEAASKILPGFGTGAYYYNEKFYAGISIPNLLRNSLEYNIDGDQNGNAKQVRHMYMMTGTIFNLGENIKVKPGVLFKYIHNAPFDADFNVSVLFVDKLWVGMTYRLEDAIAGLIGVDIADQMRVGVSYDYTLSNLSSYNNGSFEIFAEYLFRYKNKQIYNPRFFF